MFILFFSNPYPLISTLLSNLYRPHYALCIMHCALTFPCSFPDLTLLLSQICHNFVAGLSRVIRGSSPPYSPLSTLRCTKLSPHHFFQLSTSNCTQLSTLNSPLLSTFNYKLSTFSPRHKTELLLQLPLEEAQQHVVHAYRT